MNYGKRTCVLVLGMHRSGTSVLAGLLKILGVSFGDKLLAPGVDNPKGYFEHADFFHVNVAFLKSFGLDGDGRMGELPIDWLYDARTQQFKQDIKRIITEQFGDDYIFGFKDPRVSILLPVYLEVLSELKVDVCAVISVRSVAEVAASLQKRNNTPLQDSVKTYEYYYRNIDLYTKNIRHVRVQYEDVIHKTQDTVNQLIRTVHHSLRPYCDVENELEVFITPELKHHTIPEADFISTLSRTVHQLHSDLEQTRKAREHDMLWWKDQISHFTQAHTSFEEQRKMLEHSLSTTRTTFETQRAMLEDEIKQTHASFEEQRLAFEAQLVQLEEQRQMLEQAHAAVEQEYQTYKHEQHLEYVRADTHRKHVEFLVKERDKNILELHTMLTNIERSFVWKCVKGWEMLINFVLPKGTPVRRWYNACIRFNQYVLNDWLPERVVRLLKKTPKPAVVPVPKESFWDRFHRVHSTTDILFVNHEESRTGAPRIVYEIGAFLKDTHHVAMVSLKDGSMHQEFEQMFGPVIYPHDLFHMHTTYDQAMHILKHVQPKLVYVNSIGSYQFARAAKSLGVPVIFHVHELDIAFQIVFNKKEREAFHTFADKFIAVSQPVYDLLTTTMKCPKEKVVLMHEFVNRERILAQSLEIDQSIIRRELDLQPGEIVVMALGMFIYRKGADMFMNIAKQLKEKGLSVKFVWVGSRPFKEPFMADFNTYAPYFTLMQEKVNPFPYLSAADIVVLPSREDPFPLVMLESMSLKKPTVVFADGGGIKEAIKDSGIIVPDMDVQQFADAVELLVRDISKRETLGTKASHYQEAYDSSTLLPQFKTLVESMLTTL
jgi:hypothetical protein